MTNRRRFLATLAAPLTPLALARPDDPFLVYFGTYTRKNSKGIYVSRLQAASGTLSEPQLAAETPNPSFVAIHPSRKFLYSVSEAGGQAGPPGGAVSAFVIDPKTGMLKALNTVSSKGGGPCHLNVDKTGKTLVVVNYGSGSTAAIALNTDGSMKESTSFIQHAGSSANQRRQSGPHAHSVNISSDNRFAVVADLGTDQVNVYRFDAAASTISPNDPPYTKVKAGSGPRHFTFHPKGKFAYVINEMASTVTAFRWDAGKGTLTEIQSISTLPAGFTGDTSTAEVVAHPNGKFLYGSNRGHDSITVFGIDEGKGTLKVLEHVPTQGKVPRNFAIDPTGTWLFAANQNTDNVVVFKIENGMLKPSGKTLSVDSPVCVRFVAL